MADSSDPVKETKELHHILQRDFDSSKICKVEIDLAEINEQHKIAFLLQNVFSQEECTKLIEETEDIGYGQAFINIGDREVRAEGYRDGKRLLVFDKEFVKILFERTVTWGEIGCCLKYEGGDQFRVHMDGSYARPDMSSKSCITLQIYLNDSTLFEGGETTFFSYDFKVDPTFFEKSVAVSPKPGMILVFQHNMYHEGSKVTSGIKYTIRTDVMYETSYAVQRARKEQEGLLSKIARILRIK